MQESLDLEAYDLFTLVKFWSEVHLSDHAAVALRYFFQGAKVGSYILFIDNNDMGGIFLESMEEKLLSGDGIGCWIRILRTSYDSWTLPVTDRDECFEKYIACFGKENKKRYPLTHPGFVLAVYRKDTM